MSVEYEMCYAIANDMHRCVDFLAQNYTINYIEVFNKINNEKQCQYFEKYVLSKYTVKLNIIWTGLFFNYRLTILEKDNIIGNCEILVYNLFSDHIYPYICKELKCVHEKNSIINEIQYEFHLISNVNNFVDYFKDIDDAFEIMLTATNPKEEILLLNYTEELNLTVERIENVSKLYTDYPRIYNHFQRHLESMDGKRRITDKYILEIEKKYLNAFSEHVSCDIAKIIWLYVEL